MVPPSPWYSVVSVSVRTDIRQWPEWPEVPKMSNELIRPIDENTAKAIEETARFGGKLVDAGSATGGYLSQT